MSEEPERSDGGGVVSGMTRAGTGPWGVGSWELAWVGGMEGKMKLEVSAHDYFLSLILVLSLILIPITVCSSSDSWSPSRLACSSSISIPTRPPTQNVLREKLPKLEPF